MPGELEPLATQREVDAVRADVRDLRASLTRLDDHGTRGVGAVQAQLTEVVRDVSELKSDVISRFAAHTADHVQEKRDRAAARRWLITVGVTASLGVGGMFVTILSILLTGHHP